MIFVLLFNICTAPSVLQTGPKISSYFKGLNNLQQRETVEGGKQDRGKGKNKSVDDRISLELQSGQFQSAKSIFQKMHLIMVRFEGAERGGISQTLVQELSPKKVAKALLEGRFHRAETQSLVLALEGFIRGAYVVIEQHVRDALLSRRDSVLGASSSKDVSLNI